MFLLLLCVCCFKHLVRCEVMVVLDLDLNLVESVVFSSVVGKRLAFCLFVKRIFSVFLSVARSFSGGVCSPSSETVSEIGSILDLKLAHRLVICPYFKRVYSCNFCSLTKEHCGFGGRRYKFKPCFAGVRVSWICSELVGLPDFES